MALITLCIGCGLIETPKCKTLWLHRHNDDDVLKETTTRWHASVCILGNVPCLVLWTLFIVNESHSQQTRVYRKKTIYSRLDVYDVHRKCSWNILWTNYRPEPFFNLHFNTVQLIFNISKPMRDSAMKLLPADAREWDFYIVSLHWITNVCVRACACVVYL